jgi:hypothetical protein
MHTIFATDNKNNTVTNNVTVVHAVLLTWAKVVRGSEPAREENSPEMPSAGNTCQQQTSNSHSISRIALQQ